MAQQPGAGQIDWNLDYIKGTGTTVGYWHLTFEDGSTIDIKGLATARPDPKGNGTLFEGTAVVYQGSGRYAGIKGKDTLTGKRVAPIDVKAQLYFDHIITYTLP